MQLQSTPQLPSESRRGVPQTLDQTSPPRLEASSSSGAGGEISTTLWHHAFLLRHSSIAVFCFVSSTAEPQIRVRSLRTKRPLRLKNLICQQIWDHRATGHGNGEWQDLGIAPVTMIFGLGGP
nr:hypothetical protein CFP56_37123 [Quercus suber]